jgi:hypothetical protein
VFCQTTICYGWDLKSAKGRARALSSASIQPAADCAFVIWAAPGCPEPSTQFPPPNARAGKCEVDSPNQHHIPGWSKASHPRIILTAPSLSLNEGEGGTQG